MCVCIYIYICRIFYELRSLAGYRLWGHKESDATEQACTHTHTHARTRACTHTCTHTHTHTRTHIYEHPWWLSSIKSACHAGGMGSIPGSGWSPGEGNGNSLQYSCLGNLMDRGAWWAIKSMGLQKRFGHGLAAKQQGSIFIHTMHAYVHLHIPPLSLLKWTERYGYWDIDRQYMCT